MDDSIAEIRAKILPLLQRYNVTRSAVFGSVARGEADSESDVDVLVDLPSGSTLLDLVELKAALEGILMRKVDLLTFRSLHPLLKKRIEEEAVAL